jgi:hypothetical protein
MGQGMCALGVEPGNTGTLEGRSEARRLKMLTELAPGESRRYSVTISASEAQAGRIKAGECVKAPGRSGPRARSVAGRTRILAPPAARPGGLLRPVLRASSPRRNSQRSSRHDT